MTAPTRDEARERLLVELLRPIAAASSGASLGKPTINYVTVRQEDLRALLSPEGDGSDQPNERNLGWFSSFARKHGMHVQAEWMDNYRARKGSDQGSSRDHALTDGVALDGWQPIETAPRDGTVFLAWNDTDWFPAAACWDRPSSEFDDGSHEGLGEWEDGRNLWGPNEDGSRWVYADYLLHREAGAITPTHWMPLPAPPSSAMQTPDAVPGTNPKTTDKGGE